MRWFFLEFPPDRMKEIFRARLLDKLAEITGELPLSFFVLCTLSHGCFLSPPSLGAS